MNLVFAGDGGGVAGLGGAAVAAVGDVSVFALGVAGGVCVVVVWERANCVAVRSTAEQRRAQDVRLIMRAMIRQACMSRTEFFVTVTSYLPV